MNKTNTFRDLIVWQKSHQLTLEIYKITIKFPPEEKYGLTSQIRRATYSVPSNIHPVKQFQILEEFYYTYVLKSLEDSKFYTGYTKNLKLRFKQHEKGLVESTKNRRPLILIYFEACLNQTDALHREKYLKTYYGKLFLHNRLKSYLTGQTEGHSRKSKKEFLQFLNIAKGSLEELKYFLILSADLNYISKQEQKQLEELTEEVSKILYSFTNKLAADN